MGSSVTAPAGSQWVARQRNGQITWTLNTDAAPDQPRQTRIVLDRSGPPIQTAWTGPHLPRDGYTLVGPAARLTVSSRESGVADSVSYRLGDSAPVDELPSPLPSDLTSIEITALDSYGNPSTITERLRVDASGPEVTLNLESEITEGTGYSTVPARVSINAFDLETSARISSPRVAIGETIDVRGTELEVIAEDELGNVSTTTLSWRYDTEGPVAKVLFEGESYAPGKLIRLSVDDAVEFEVSDAGVGVSDIEYRYNGNRWLPLPNRLRFLNRGRYRLDVRSTDRVGNQTKQRWSVMAR